MKFEKTNTEIRINIFGVLSLFACVCLWGGEGFGGGGGELVCMCMHVCVPIFRQKNSFDFFDQNLFAQKGISAWKFRKLMSG